MNYKIIIICMLLLISKNTFTSQNCPCHRSDDFNPVAIPTVVFFGLIGFGVIKSCVDECIKTRCCTRTIDDESPSNTHAQGSSRLLKAPPVYDPRHPMTTRSQKPMIRRSQQTMQTRTEPQLTKELKGE